MQSKINYMRFKENTFLIKCKYLDEEETTKMVQGIDIYEIAEMWVDEFIDDNSEYLDEIYRNGVVIDIKENDKDWKKILVNVEHTLSFYSEDYKEENNGKV